VQSADVSNTIDYIIYYRLLTGQFFGVVNCTIDPGVIGPKLTRRPITIFCCFNCCRTIIILYCIEKIYVLAHKLKKKKNCVTVDELDGLQMNAK